MIGTILEVAAELVAEGVCEGLRGEPDLGVCARCRKAPAAVSVPAGGAGMVCERCATLIARNHRAGELFFFGIAVLMGLMGILLAVLAYQRGAPLSATDAILILCIGVGLPASMGWGIRAFTRPRRPTRDNSQDPTG